MVLTAIKNDHSVGSFLVHNSVTAIATTNGVFGSQLIVVVAISTHINHWFLGFHWLFRLLHRPNMYLSVCQPIGAFS